MDASSERYTKALLSFQWAFLPRLRVSPLDLGHSMLAGFERVSRNQVVQEYVLSELCLPVRAFRRGVDVAEKAALPPYDKVLRPFRDESSLVERWGRRWRIRLCWAVNLKFAEIKCLVSPGSEE